MTYLSLDLSKSSTGWCWWDGEAARPVYGHWVLGSEFSSPGQVFAKLHRHMAEHYALMPFEGVFVEPPINPAQLQGHTTIQTIRLAIGLAAHVESFVHAYPCRWLHECNVDSWRPDFIGRVEDAAAKAAARRAKNAGDARASARDTLKELTMARCRQLGFTPRKNDEADAIGIMTYGLLVRNITPPWLNDEVLRAPVGSAAA